MHLMSYKIVTWLVATSRRGLKIILGWVLIFAASQRLFTGKCPEKSQWNDPKTTIGQVWNKDIFREKQSLTAWWVILSTLWLVLYRTEEGSPSPRVKVPLDRRNSRLRLTRDKHLISLERESHRLHWHAQQWSGDTWDTVTVSTSVSSNDDEWRSMQCQLWCLESRPGVAAARRLGPDTAVETWTPGTSLAPPKIARHGPALARAAWLVTSPVPVTAAVEIILNTPALHWETWGWHSKIRSSLADPWFD